MTSAPVKDVSSLLNFVGNRNLTTAGGTNKAGSFENVMSKTQSGSEQTADTQKAVKAERENTVQKENAAVKKTAAGTGPDRVKNTRPATEKTADTNTSDEQMEAIGEAGEQMIQNVADEMGVSTEDVETAMEELGLSVYSLFDPSELSKLVMELSGEQDPMALLTDENLFETFQDLLQCAGELKNELAQTFEMDEGELGTMLKELQTQNMDPAAENIRGEMPDVLNGGKQAGEEAPRITVEVQTASETVKLEADENGNPIKVQETVPQETKETAPLEHQQGQEQKEDQKGRGQEGTLQTGNGLLNTLNENAGQTQEVSFEQTAAHFRPDTQEIMDQILDYMKIQLKPGMDQLEMQLHPESLGTVHIQLTNKGGEISAQFQVQNEEVKAVLESQMAELKESLKDQGVKVEAVQVTVENHGFESNLWQGQGGEQNASSQENRKSPRRINLDRLDELFAEEVSEEEQLTVEMMKANGNTVDYTA